MTRDQLGQLLGNMIVVGMTSVRQQQLGAIVAACKSGMASRHDCVLLCREYDFSMKAFQRLTKE